MKKTLLPAASLLLAAIPAAADVTTLTFDGTGDAYGIERQFSNKPEDLTFSSDLSFSEDGVDVAIRKISETGDGFALVDAGDSNCGLLVYSGLAAATYLTPEISLSVPGGTISKVVLAMTGSALSALDIECNGVTSESAMENGLYYWTWNLKDASDKASFSWENKFYGRYIHSIEITYTPDLGGKEACGLTFATPDLEAYLGETVTSPILSNPNKLALTWSSSDPEVATVDDKGKLTLLAAGTTVITAATEGDASHAAGNAKYTLTVVPTATSIAEMMEFAPANYDKVKVNCPLTVNFAYSSFAFVTDEDGHAACIENIKNQGSTSTTVTTIYSKGEVIPAGWVATDLNLNNSVTWQGIPGAVKETVNVEYPVVSAVIPEDVNRVVILESVKFETATASEFTKAYGTTHDGTRYEFQDNYGTTTEPAGTYNVTCVVKYSKVGSTEYFYLAPIAYSEGTLTGVETINANPADARYFNLQGVETSSPRNGIFIKMENGKSSKVIIK